MLLPVLVIHFLRSGSESNSFRYCLLQGWTNYGPWIKSQLLPGFVNKFLLEDSHSH